MANNRQLAICELFYPHIHGDMRNNWNSTPYLIYSTISLSEFYDKSYEEIISMLKQGYRGIINHDIKHPFIRNFKFIIRKPNYICINIVEQNQLSTGEHIACLKTFWIKIIQRTWKKIFKQRREIDNKKKCLSSLNYRETYSKWPKGLNIYPKLYLK
jgi:hypothetical protein